MLALKQKINKILRDINKYYNQAAILSRSVTTVTLKVYNQKIILTSITHKPSYTETTVHKSIQYDDEKILAMLLSTLESVKQLYANVQKIVQAEKIISEVDSVLHPLKDTKHYDA